MQARCLMYENTKGGTNVKDLVSINCSTRIKQTLADQSTFGYSPYQFKNYSRRISTSSEAFNLQFYLATQKMTRIISVGNITVMVYKVMSCKR